MDIFSNLGVSEYSCCYADFTYDDGDDESFSSAPSSPADKGFLKPPSAQQSSQSAQKRRASSTWDEPSRSKLAAVADKSQGLRKKKLR